VTLLHVTRGSAEATPPAHAHLRLASATLRAFDVANQMRIRAARNPIDGILAEIAVGNHDLIVIGSLGPQSRSPFALGDVTLQLLAHADQPVLVVPSEEV